MTIRDKIEKSASESTFTIFKEGSFYKCYNEDAMVFSAHIKPYKINVKFIKYIGSEVMSLGFPLSEVETGRLSYDVILAKLGAVNVAEAENMVVFHLNQNLKRDFQSWREKYSNQESNDLSVHHSVDSNVTVAKLIDLIKTFDLANSTPMQGINFIHDLKRIVQQMN